MRILVTADLHYDIARCQAPARRLAERICAMGGDALVLVGDCASARLEPLGRCLELFEGFGGLKLMVAGNHCLWCRPGENSLDRWRYVLPAVAEEYGFRLLDHGPVVLGDTALVGSVGWYDYSFRDESLGIPEAFYRAKLSPGAAARLGGYEDLLAAHRDELTDEHMNITARWMDGWRVRLGISDEQFVRLLARRLAGHLREVSRRARRVVAFVHHLPFRQLVPSGRPAGFAFAAAYMGAAALGEALLGCEKLTHVYCGHSHWPAEVRLGRLAAVNVGSTYTNKRLEILEL
ncbi:MAG: metallophosphoesterase [Planctomycetes bacterium]|nr:metallophosphoesterase [Planctomycetota bacterium]